MKHTITLFAVLLMALAIPHSIFAYDFSYTYQGKTLYYSITNSSGHTVAVVNPANLQSGGYYSYVTGDVVIPDSVEYGNTKYYVTSIGDDAFLECYSLTSVIIPNSVTSIGYRGFQTCVSLTSIIIPDSVTSIGSQAFHQCSGLTTVAIPESVTSIGSHAFSGCINLTSISIPEGITSIGDCTFDGCSSLSTILIPASVITIGMNAFNNCTSLTSVIIPNGVVFIDEFAFKNCSSLTSITIGEGVVSIAGNAFLYCNGINSIVVAAGNNYYDSRENCNALIQTATNLLLKGSNTTVIPSTVTAIAAEAFFSCSGLTSVTIPDSVTSIGAYSFYGCGGLTSVTIGGGVTSIAYGAFGNCSNLTSIYCNATLPPAITYANDLPVFYNTNNCPIFVPCGSMTAYQNASHWDELLDRLRGMPDINYVYVFIPNNDTMGIVNVGEVDCDSNVTVTAIANTGFQFIGWNDGDISNPRTFTLTQDTIITALFAEGIYTLTVQSNDSTLGEVSGNGTFGYLDTASITATTIMPHHHFVRWSDGSTEAIRNIIMTQDSQITAIFAIDTHSVTVLSNSGDYGTVTGDTSVAYGSAVTIEATAAEGYNFAEWSNGSRENPYTITVTSDTILMAVFIPDVVPEIYMVTVQNGRNVVIWEKGLEVQQYNIYREGNTSDVYELVATMPYDAEPQWTDTASRPRNRSYRYRMTATDLYGYESEPSTVHKTMHLTINQGVGNEWNLVWTPYEGADYSTYGIYRGTDASNIQQIDVMPSSGNTTYTDDSAPNDTVYYQVGILLSDQTKSSNIILSNIATNGTTEGIGECMAESGMWIVYVMDGKIVVKGAEGETVRIYDMMGRDVTADGATVFSGGIYLVKIGKHPARRVVVTR